MRGWIYDRSLVALTGSWYEAVLSRLDPGSRLLDVGIGTAGALLTQTDTLRSRDLHVVGVDVDRDYVGRARRAVARAGLRDRIEVRHEPVEDHQGGPYDAVYFAASFMLLDDPTHALRHAASLLAPEGALYFTQTFQERPSRAMEALKPVLRKVTTIDFGRVTYEEDFFETLSEGGMTVTDHQVLGGGAVRTSRLVVAVPA